MKRTRLKPTLNNNPDQSAHHLDVIAKLILPPKRVKQILWVSSIAILSGIFLYLSDGALFIGGLLTGALFVVSLCLWFAYSGKLLKAVIIFTAMLTLLTCTLMVNSGGIFDETIGIFPSILIIGSLFGTRRQFILLLGAIIGFLGAMTFANLNGWMASEVLTTSSSAFLTIALILSTNGFFIYVVANDFRNALVKLNNSESNLLDLNQQLENRVADRIAELRESESHLRAILDNSAEGIITIDNRGILLSLNPAAVKIFGYEVSEVLGKNIKCLMPEPYAAAHDQYLSNYLRTREAKVIGIGREVSGLHKDGHIFPLDLTVSEMQANGQPVYIGIVRDITVRKQAELLKSEFISTVSHELRTPLTSILGALSLINEGKLGAVPLTMQAMLDIAQRNGQRLHFLINDILDIEKLDSGKMTFDMQPQSLKALIEKTLTSNQTYRAERGVELVLSEHSEDALVNIDAQRFTQVISNLLSNALKYSPDHDRVVVSIIKNATHVRVEVCDHGPGIPDEFRSRIFGKFAQADSSDTRVKGGTGLGLSITKKLVECMEGKIGYESTPGAGATFFVELPIVQVQ